MELENEKCVMPNYEERCRELERELVCANEMMEEIKSINGYLQRELDIYKAKYSVVELIFGNGGVK